MNERECILEELNTYIDDHKDIKRFINHQLKEKNLKSLSDSSPWQLVSFYHMVLCRIYQ